MPRYLPVDSIAATLARSAAIEQFLGRYVDDSLPRVAWIEIRQAQGRYEVRRFDADDLGDREHADLYEWVDMNEMPDIFVFEKPEQAIEFSTGRWAASLCKWVNAGVLQDEYLDALVDPHAQLNLES